MDKKIKLLHWSYLKLFRNLIVWYFSLISCRLKLNISRNWTAWLGLTASLVSHFFSQEFCGNRDSLFAKISVLFSRVLGISLEGKNAIYCEAFSLAVCEPRNLRDSETSKIKIHWKKLVLDPKISQDSLKTPEIKLVMILASLATQFLFARLMSLATKFVCETREKQVLPRNFCLRDSWVLLQN